MKQKRSLELGEKVLNVIENVACRVARQTGGDITPFHVMVHLPVSLDIVKETLDTMAEDDSVSVESKDGMIGYSLAAYQGQKLEQTDFESSACVSCGTDMDSGESDMVCHVCTKELRNLLNDLAEKNAWPAQAVYEHVVMYHAERQKGPIHAESLAGSSRYTLRNMRNKLQRLVEDQYIRVEDHDGVKTYLFPQVDYPKKLFRKNMEQIRTYPSSFMEEMQLKTARIFFTLGGMVFGMLMLAFLGFPFPFLLMGFLVAAPIIAILIWKKKEKISDYDEP